MGQGKQVDNKTKTLLRQYNMGQGKQVDNKTKTLLIQYNMGQVIGC